MDPASGKVLWRYPFETDFGCNIATPIAVDGGVYISAGENHGGTLLDIEPSAGGFTPKERWTSFGPSSVLRCEWQTPLLIDGHLFGFDNVGGAGPVSHLACIEAKTGKRIWQKTRFGKGNAVAADGVIYILTFDGQLVTIAATPKGYSEIARAKVSDKTRTAPSLANGLLYLRDDKEIVCLDLRQK
jgi:outer membrane protein assembly factor BamB